MPAWTVEVKPSAIEDLRALGRSAARVVLEAAIERLTADPTASNRNQKPLRPNPVAERELRVLGKYRILYSVDAPDRRVIILLAGEKRGDALIVRGRRYTAHESYPAD